MIPEIGHFALIITLMMAITCATVPLIGSAMGNQAMMRLADRLSVGMVCFVGVATAALSYSFLTSDFSVSLVVKNSHTEKPLLYKIAGLWANHEGSLLFWVQNLTLFSALVSIFGKKLPLSFRAKVLAVQAMIAIGFLLFMLLTSNPFERMPVAPAEGLGLNPLLQDPGLVFHPPMLYLGYVGLSVAFSFAIAALIEEDVTPAWARWVRPWTLLAWCFLTAGIALGSWWAYYELGWGGWWFWDPTENASFMPWLAATALLHSAIVVEKREALKSWTVLLAIVAFSFSLLGTFLVRSGIVTSVHAFATDPERGIFILTFLGLVIGASLFLYLWNARAFKGSGVFALISRETGLVLNNILLSTYAAVVLIGTLYPLVLEWVNGTQISVGPPFFNFATIVLMSPLVVALAIGPLLSWKRGKLSRAAQVLLPALIIAIVVFVASYWGLFGGTVMTAFGLMLGTWLTVGVLTELNQRIKFISEPKKAWARMKRQPRGDWGMRSAHLGVAILVFGITISEAFVDETLVVMKPGDTATVGGYEMTFDGVEPIAGPNYSAVRGIFTAREGGEIVTTLTPEDRLYNNPVMPTTEASITPFLSGDLYAVIGEQVTTNSWSMRLYFKPFISGIWLGALLMVLGAILSLTDRRLRIGKVRKTTS